jgi:hypothetical protein
MTWSKGFDAQAVAAASTTLVADDGLTPLLRQVEMVTTRVLALDGFQAVLHHTSILTPSTEGSSGVEGLFQQYVGGLALRVWPADKSGE